MMDRAIVAIDPPATVHSDVCAIIGGRIKGGAILIEADATLNAGPHQWARAAIMLARELGATIALTDVGAGRDMMRALLRGIDPGTPILVRTNTRPWAQRATQLLARIEGGGVGFAAGLDQLDAELRAVTGNLHHWPRDRVEALATLVEELTVPAQPRIKQL